MQLEGYFLLPLRTADNDCCRRRGSTLRKLAATAGACALPVFAIEAARQYGAVDKLYMERPLLFNVLLLLSIVHAFGSPGI